MDDADNKKEESENATPEIVLELDGAIPGLGLEVEKEAQEALAKSLESAEPQADGDANPHELLDILGAPLSDLQNIAESAEANPATPLIETSVAPAPLPEIGMDELTMPPLEAPAAGMVATHRSNTPPTASTEENIAEVRDFAEKIAVGAARLEANPAFSLKATGIRTAKAVKAVEDALGAHDFGVRIEDVRVQLDTGRLLVPQISEFAAVTLAQLLREHIDEIEVGLAEEIFASASHGVTQESAFIDPVEGSGIERSEFHDVAFEPTSEISIITTNLPTLEGYRIHRVLSLVATSQLIDATLAENPKSAAYGGAVDALTKDLIAKAYRLRATAIIGMSYTLKAIEGFKDNNGITHRSYRLMAVGTAVQAQRVAEEKQSASASILGLTGALTAAISEELLPHGHGGSDASGGGILSGNPFGSYKDDFTSDKE